jgi:large subunit ribosomal protein L25
MELKAKNRTIFGKKVKNLREEGLVPAELFGHGIKNVHLSVSAKEFGKIYKVAGENTIITLVTGDDKKIPVLISAVEHNALTDNLLSIDFYGVRMDEKIKIKIPVEFIGVAPALKSGHLLIRVTDEIEVEALPGKIPHNFKVDLSALENPGQGIHVNTLKAPADVKIITPGDLVIVTIGEKRKEEEVAPAPATAETAAPAEAGTETKSEEETGK